MSTSNHVKTSTPSDKDLETDPGIGQSKGLNRFEGNDAIAGDNTDEGDVSNDTNRFGGVDPDQRGRANK